MERDDGLEEVREVPDDSVTGTDAGRAERSRELPGALLELAPGRLGVGTKLGGVPNRDGRRVAPAEDVLRVVEARTGEPLGARHRARPEHALVRLGSMDVEELPDGDPERLDLRHRPVPEVVVAGRLDAARLRQPAGVPRDRGTLEARLVGFPENGWRVPHGMKPMREPPGANKAVAAPKGMPSGMCPAVGGDPSGRVPLQRNPACEQG